MIPLYVSVFFQENVHPRWTWSWWKSNQFQMPKMKQIYNIITINYISLVHRFKHPVSDSQNTKTTVRDKATALWFGQKKQETNQREANSWILNSSLTKEEAGQPSASVEYPLSMWKCIWIWTSRFEV